MRSLIFKYIYLVEELSTHSIEVHSSIDHPNFGSWILRFGHMHITNLSDEFRLY